MSSLNLREVPQDLVIAAKVEATKRAMTIREWVMETIRFRLDLMNGKKPKRK